MFSVNKDIVYTVNPSAADDFNYKLFFLFMIPSEFIFLHSFISKK